MKLSSKQIAAAVGGTHHGADVMLHAVNTDSRKSVADALFVALRGERFDGHDYVALASTQGASAALVERAVDADLTQIIVPDTRVALGKLARYWRLQMNAAVVGLTGSCGKTTVKEMLASILRQRGQTLATQGNLNNDLGVPLTLLRLSTQDEFAVIEMGANHRGEIAYCAQVAQPIASLITMVAPAHLEGFGSIDGVAQAKAEIYQALPVDGCAIVNADDTYADYFRQQIGARRRIEFGMQNAADVRASHVTEDVSGCAKFKLHLREANAFVQLPLPGRHNIMNALAAAALALALDLSLTDIVNGLQQAPGVAGRMNLLRGRHGEQLIDDTYNANPGSMRAALDYLATRSGRRIAVLGAMGEMGGDAEALHAQVGEYARAKNLDAVYTLAGLSRHIATAANGHHFDDLSALVAALEPQLNAQTSVLIKGSRSAAMERVVQALAANSDMKNNNKNNAEMH